MKYCTITRPQRVFTEGLASNPLCPDVKIGQTLGTQILAAMDYETDIGSNVPVAYDPDDVEACDALADPNHDIFDLAELGEQIGISAGAAAVPSEDSDDVDPAASDSDN